MWPVVNPPDAVPQPAPMRSPNFARALDRIEFHGRCQATTKHRWTSEGGQVCMWPGYGQPGPWQSSEEELRCKRDAIPTHDRHLYYEPPVLGFQHDERRHEWSEETTDDA